MVSDIISAVKLFFDTIKDKKTKSREDRKTILTNFIQPVYDMLEVSHKKYLENFQQYRETILQYNGFINLSHPIFEMIQKDHAMSDADRAKLVAMSEYLNTYKSEAAKELGKMPAGKLGQAVIDYITTPNYELTQRWGFNAPRHSLLLQMESCAKSDRPDEEKKKTIIRIIEEAVEKLQKQYAGITRIYMEAKADLLV